MGQDGHDGNVIILAMNAFNDEDDGKEGLDTTEIDEAVHSETQEAKTVETGEASEQTPVGTAEGSLEGVRTRRCGSLCIQEGKA